MKLNLNIFRLILLAGDLKIIIMGTLAFITGIGNFYNSMKDYQLWISIASILIIIISIILLLQLIRRVLILKKIQKFYSEINKKKSKSWSLLSNKLKQRWNHDKKKFSDGFYYTENISIIKIIKYGYCKKEKTHSFIVLYRDNLDSPVIKGLPSVQNMTIAEFSKINNFVEEISSEYKEMNLIKFKNLKAKLLFEYNFSDIVRWSFDRHNLSNTTEKNQKTSKLAVRKFSLKNEGSLFNSSYKIIDISEL